MENEFIVRIQAPAQIIMLRPLDVFVRHLIQQLPAFEGSQEIVDNLELAFSEAFTNICRHAYRSQDKGPVSIEIKVDSDQLEFRFEDNGETFDPDKVKCPNLDVPGEGGLGIWLIRQVMDEYIYFCENGEKNVLRLIKRFSP
jgi:serine/threonine-protein kinase RsbW